MYSGVSLGHLSPDLCEEFNCYDFNLEILQSLAYILISNGVVESGKGKKIKGIGNLLEFK